MTLHPIVGLINIIVQIIFILLSQNIVDIFIIFIINISIYLIYKKLDILKRTFIYLIYLCLPIILINPLISQMGNIVLFKSIRLPVVGKIIITYEALMYGIYMAFQLSCVILIIGAFGIMTNKDNNFNFFSRFLRKFTLTISLTVNIIHKLKIDIVRIKEVLTFRGIDFNSKNLVKRIHAFYYLFKIILIESLEGAFDRAKALYLKGFSAKKRTYYKKIEFGIPDILIIILNIGLIYYRFIRRTL